MVVLGGLDVSYGRGTPVRAVDCCSVRLMECSTKMCSGSEAGSYLRLIDFVYHSTLGLRVIKKRRGEETFDSFLAQSLPGVCSVLVQNHPASERRGHTVKG